MRELLGLEAEVIHRDVDQAPVVASRRFAQPGDGGDLVTGSGDDHVRATQIGWSHHIETGAGNDTVELGAGNDYIATGDGNDTIYGLAAYIAGPVEDAKPVARRLRAGTVNLNYPDWDTSAPFGGYKQSGNGREYADWGIHDFCEVKGIVGYGE